MAVFDNLGGGEDISAIIDAIEGMGVEVPEGASSEDVAELISEKLYVPPLTESGTVAFGTVYAKNTVDKVVVFSVPFAETPTIQVGKVSGTTYNSTSMTIVNKSKSGFTIRVYNGDSGDNINPTYNWTASA